MSTLLCGRWKLSHGGLWNPSRIPHLILEYLTPHSLKLQRMCVCVCVPRRKVGTCMSLVYSVTFLFPSQNFLQYIYRMIWWIALSWIKGLTGRGRSHLNLAWTPKIYRLDSLFILYTDKKNKPHWGISKCVCISWMLIVIFFFLSLKICVYCCCVYFYMHVVSKRRGRLSLQCIILTHFCAYTDFMM